MPTIFTALQCCQCSTMQVKQQKKSTNKWSCVVCNQKQSVRKVYAQGFMAKDVRKFVQSFNMSRQLAEQSLLLEEDDQTETLGTDDQFSINRKQKRTDWFEYVDPAEDDFKSSEIDGKGDESEPKIVTEMPPKALFKKPKLKHHSAATKMAADQASEARRGLGRRVGGDPMWGDENAAKIINRFDKAKEPQPTCRTSKWQKCFSTPEDEDDKSEKKVPLTNHSAATSKNVSKWSSYITEDSDDFLPARGGDSKIQAETFENVPNDQRVEEDIHPDFS